MSQDDDFPGCAVATGMRCPPERPLAFPWLQQTGGKETVLVSGYTHKQWAQQALERVELCTSHIFLLILEQSDIKYSKIRMQLPLISFLNFLSRFITTFVAVADRNGKFVQYLWFLLCLAFYFTFRFFDWPMTKKIN